MYVKAKKIKMNTIKLNKIEKHNGTDDHGDSTKIHK